MSTLIGDAFGLPPPESVVRGATFDNGRVSSSPREAKRDGMRREGEESTFGRAVSDCRGRVFVAPFHNLSAPLELWCVCVYAVGHYVATSPSLSLYPSPLSIFAPPSVVPFRNRFPPSSFSTTSRYVDALSVSMAPGFRFCHVWGFLILDVHPAL